MAAGVRNLLFWRGVIRSVVDFDVRPRQGSLAAGFGKDFPEPCGCDQRYPPGVRHFTHDCHVLAGILKQIDIHLRPDQNLIVLQSRLNAFGRLRQSQPPQLHLAAKGDCQLSRRIHAVRIGELGSVVDVDAQQVSRLDTERGEVLGNEDRPLTLKRGSRLAGGRDRAGFVKRVPGG